MNGEPLCRSIVISNPQGLHMRPITTFVELAGKFQSVVTVIKNGERFNGKSPISLLGLGAEKGTELTLEVCGPDQDQAMQDLGALLTRLAAEEQSASEEPSA
jgi:phosphocarrier protein HPr